MPQIEIDFDVFKALTGLREREEMSCNDVIRGLLKLGSRSLVAVRSKGGSEPWVVSDTSFPTGSRFAANHKGKNYTGVVKDGKLEMEDGRRFSTPSAAAVSITGSNVNGWRFWKCKLPSDSQYVLIERLRGKVH